MTYQFFISMFARVTVAVACWEIFCGQSLAYAQLGSDIGKLQFPDGEVRQSDGSAVLARDRRGRMVVAKARQKTQLKRGASYGYLGVSSSLKSSPARNGRAVDADVLVMTKPSTVSS